MPALSIVTVVKNDSERLSRTASSILIQSSDDFEWIIWDSMSTDDTRQIIAALGEGYISYLTGYDSGIYDGMNKALEYTNGKWILFLNAGDEFNDENSVQALVQNLSQTTASVCYADYILNQDGKKSLKRQPPFKKGPIYRSLCHQAVVVRFADVSADLFFDTSYTVAADFDLFLRLEIKGYSFDKLDQHFSIFETGGFSERSYLQAMQDRERIFNKRPLSFIARQINLLNVKRLKWKYKRSSSLH